MAQSDAETCRSELRLLTPQRFYSEYSLYRRVIFNRSNRFEREAIEKVINFLGPFECYCLGCQQHSIFRGKARTALSIRAGGCHDQATVGKRFGCIFECARNPEHDVMFSCQLEEDACFKIGQYPSLADLSAPDLRKYRNPLGDELYCELTRAVGLNAHGIGIGAFVYLRRIFERLLEEAQQAELGMPGWDEDAYARGRMEDRIALLKHALPAFLVENKIIYSLLSKGIHEMTEEECLSGFPALRGGIELILDEKLAEKERQRKVNDAKKAISDYSSKIMRPT